VPDTNSELEDPDAWTAMLETGLAIAPVAGANVVTASVDASVFFADELHDRLATALPGTPVTRSGVIFGRLEDRGPDAHARLRSLRRHLVREEPLDASELASLGQDIGERFLLVVLMDEGAIDGVQRTKLDDYRAFSYSMDTHGYPTGELRGLALGFLLDLREASRVWRAEVKYESKNLATAGKNTERLIAETRANAALRLSEALALADR
jgi:hypothetical protein